MKNEKVKYERRKLEKERERSKEGSKDILERENECELISIMKGRKAERMREG